MLNKLDIEHFNANPKDQISPDDAATLNSAVKNVIDTMDAETKACYWMRMTRPMDKKIGRACPPYLKEKWESCGTNKDLKNECFGMFIACGGDIGKMEALEQEVRTEIEKTADTDSWNTLEELQEKLLPSPPPSPP